MLKDASKRRFNVVMAWAIDRMGRSLIDLLGTIQTLEACGVDLYLDQQAIDTPEAAVDLVEQLIVGEGTQGSPQTKPSNEDNSGSAMLAALRAEFPAHIFDNVPRKRE